MSSTTTPPSTDQQVADQNQQAAAANPTPTSASASASASTTPSGASSSAAAVPAATPTSPSPSPASQTEPATGTTEKDPAVAKAELAQLGNKKGVSSQHDYKKPTVALGTETSVPTADPVVVSKRPSVIHNALQAAMTLIGKAGHHTVEELEVLAQAVEAELKKL